MRLLDSENGYTYHDPPPVYPRKRNDSGRYASNCNTMVLLELVIVTIN